MHMKEQAQEMRLGTTVHSIDQSLWKGFLNNRCRSRRCVIPNNSNNSGTKWYTCTSCPAATPHNVTLAECTTQYNMEAKQCV